jgi:hypothetical protein
MAWLYAPVAADLKRDCILCSPVNIAPYVLLKGKPTPLHALSRLWKKRAWVRVLCGMTLPPSILDRGVESYISSLRDTPASRSQTPESVLANAMNVISGPTSGGLYSRLCRNTFSVRTSPRILPEDSIQSKVTWNNYVTGLKRESSARLKSALRICANDFSSLGSWPTPNTVDQKGGTRNGKGQKQLCHVVKNNWPTPAAAQCVQGQNDPDGRRGQTLVGAARGQNWPTPRASDGPNQRGSKGYLMLPSAIQNWGTPAARDWRAGAGRNGQLSTDIFRGRGPQDAGKSKTLGSNLVLNPLWVEQLMGWPPGTSNYTCSEMELSRWLRQWRLWLFGVI